MRKEGGTSKGVVGVPVAARPVALGRLTDSTAHSTAPSSMRRSIISFTSSAPRFVRSARTATDTLPSIRDHGRVADVTSIRGDVEIRGDLHLWKTDPHPFESRGVGIDDPGDLAALVGMKVVDQVGAPVARTDHCNTDHGLLLPSYVPPGSSGCKSLRYGAILRQAPGDRRTPSRAGDRERAPELLTPETHSRDALPEQAEGAPKVLRRC